MKTVSKAMAQTFLVGLFTFTTAVMAPAQSLNNEPFWTLETNDHINDYSVIRFYNADNQLVYEERLEGISLDVQQKRVVQMLNRTLHMVHNNALIAGQLKGYSESISATIAKKRDHHTKH